MRAIIIIVLILASFVYVGYRLYGVMSYSAKVTKKAEESQVVAHDLVTQKSKASADTEQPVFYTLEDAASNPLLQRTFYQDSKGTLSGIAWRAGVVTAFTTDGRMISATQIKAIGRDWVLLKTGAYLRFPPPRPSDTPKEKAEFDTLLDKPRSTSKVFHVEQQ